MAKPVVKKPVVAPVVQARKPAPRPVKVAARPVPARDARPVRVAKPVPVSNSPATRPPNPNSTLGPPPKAYAGGQVATGGQLGLLGNRGVLNTPFNQTSYTAKLIQDQQARTIGDVLDNDPSVRNVSIPSTGTQVFFIRGFYYDSGDIALNGLYGLTPQYQTASDFAERVEVLKGPSALLNGISPAGAVGGSINIVTKRASDVDIAQVTPFFISRSTYGVSLDVSHRAGPNKEWGVRFNGQYQNGGTPFERQTDQFGNAVLGVDYRGEHVRVSVDAGYQADNLNPPIRFLTPLPTLASIPPAPKAGTNFEVPWATWHPQDTFAMARAEVDVTDWATVYGAWGYHNSIINFIYPSPTITDTQGDYLSRPFFGYSRFRTMSGETGVRAAVDTGPIHHALSVNYSGFDQPNNTIFNGGTIISSNIYHPAFVPVQTQAMSTLLQAQRTAVQDSSLGVADTASILNERIQLTAGVRRQTVDQSALNNLAGTPNSESDSRVFSPAFALLIKPVANLSFYANYIQGLQPGQTVGIGFANSGQQFPAYVSKQIETGVKYDAGRFTTTLSFFQITQPQVVTETSASTATSTQALDGQQRNQGAEVDVFGELSPDIRLLGGFTYIDGRLTQTSGGLYDGKHALGVANYNINLGAEWDIPFIARGLTLTGRVIYTSEEYVNEANTQMIPDWTRFDLGARYTFKSPVNGKPIIVKFTVENVADHSYYASTYEGVLAVGAPRTYLASTTFNF